MSVLASQVRPGAYYDSLVLMQLQRGLLALPGVQDAGAVMATPVNLEILGASDLLPPDKPGPDDLLIVVRAEDQGAAEAALGQIDTLLARRRSATLTAYSPKSLDAAARQSPQADWVLVSVPGRFAAGVARDALRLGRNVFLYSDNVSVEDEIGLKEEAARLGRLVMGPDCGTAIVGGIGFGFANRVRRGSIGLVAASGTGLQAVTSAIDALGSGVSQAIGTGGRDLHAEVGASTTRQAIDLLRRDPQTAVIVIVSKPPSPEVVGPVVAAALAAAKPVVLNLIGLPGGGRVRNLHFAATLEDAAAQAAQLSKDPPQFEPLRPPSGPRRFLRGLFSGGTLAYETVLRLQDILQPLFTNVAIHPWQKLGDPLHSQGHTVLDLGADAFTVGRLHPMIDNDLRVRRIRQEADDPETAVLLLDLVLGEGAHPDPASELGPVIREVADRGIPTVVALVGTESDPQNLADQAATLEASGAIVKIGLAPALEAVVTALPFEAPPIEVEVPLSILSDAPATLSVGLESFAESLAAQGSQVLHVDWRPPAGGDERLMDILARMRAAKG